MVISLDTNIWIFGLTKTQPASMIILDHLARWSVLVPDQVRTELERNLSQRTMQRFYQFVAASQATIDYAPVAEERIAAFKQHGLKKGDAVIAAFCEQHAISIFISDNRDFLRTLAPSASFQIVSPSEFCAMFGLTD